MGIIAEYTNGNTEVKLYNDGTKIRVTNGDTAILTHPESMDVKITDYCDLGCAFCHEKSTVKGKHADLGRLLNVLSELPPGVELALGGGNPLDHPELIPFLEKLNEKGYIPNITINYFHAITYNAIVQELMEKCLVCGIGISMTSTSPTVIEDLAYSFPKTSNAVFHVINGLTPIDICLPELNRLTKIVGLEETKVLILGYKTFGRGVQFANQKGQDLVERQYDWYTKIGKYLRQEGFVFSFDNLALEQLNIKRFFDAKTWSRCFMGNDGQYTMYIDAVKQQYAKSSTSVDRVNFNDTTLTGFFKSLNENN